MSTRTMIGDEIRDELEGLKKIELGTECYKVTVGGVCDLLDRLIEMEKLENDAQERAASRLTDAQLKREQLDEDKKSCRLSTAVAIGTTLLTLGVTVWGTIKTLKFEETGTVTTIMGRGFVNKLLPKK